MRRPVLTAIISTAALSLSLLSAQSAAAQRSSTPPPAEERYAVLTQEHVAVPLSDGVQLNATVGRPADPATGEAVPGRFPVIVQQSPYGTGIAQFFVQNGYIVVNVNPRGTQLSGGDIRWLSKRDAKDGVEVANWAAKELAGTNGRVGLYGCSYHGVNQVQTAAAAGPRSPIKAIIPSCAWGDAYAETFFSGGVPTQTVPAMPASFAAGFGGHPATVDFFNQFYTEIESGGPRSHQGEFWQERNVVNYAGAVARNGIPTLLWTGWEDVVEGGSLDVYAALQNAASGRSVHAAMKPTQKTDPRFQIIVGPGGHGRGLDNEVMLSWYDHFLRGKTSPLASRKTAHLFESGANRWIDASTYPLDTKYDQFFLANGSNLATSSMGREQGSVRLTWTQPEERNGSVSFTSKALKSQRTVAGPVSATLYASSSTSQAHLITALYEVQANGDRSLITNGSVLGTKRVLDRSKSWIEKPSQIVQKPAVKLDGDSRLKPGKMYRFDIKMQPRVWRLKAGSRLELVVSTQVPVANCGVGLGTDPCYPTRPQRAALAGAKFELEWSRRHPSAVNVPLVEPGSLRNAIPMIAALTQ